MTFTADRQCHQCLHLQVIGAPMHQGSPVIECGKGRYRIDVVTWDRHELRDCLERAKTCAEFQVDPHGGDS